MQVLKILRNLSYLGGALLLLTSCGDSMSGTKVKSKRTQLQGEVPLGSEDRQSDDQVEEVVETNTNPQEDEQSQQDGQDAPSTSTTPKTPGPVDPDPVVDQGEAEEIEEIEEIEEEEVDTFKVFGETVYPLVRKNCFACHDSAVQPYFAVGDRAASQEALVASAKVDIARPEKSRIYLRLAEENHNCWSDCASDSQEMLTAIQTWADGFGDFEEEVDPNETGAQSLTSGIQVEVSDPTTKAMLAANGQIQAPMVKLDDDPDGDILEYLVVPEGNGGRIAPDDVGGLATFNFDIEQAGTYAVWGRVNAADNGSDSFHISVDGGPFLRWNTGVTNDEWQWVRANNNDDELTFQFQPGPHTVVIKQREELTKFNAVAVTTTLVEFQGANLDDKVYQELTFDLQPVSGKAATLKVFVSEFDAESKTILLSNLRVETSETIVIRDVMPLVNGAFNIQHSNYRIVNQTINAPGGVLSESSLVLQGDDGFSVDQLSFTFGTIE